MPKWLLPVIGTGAVFAILFAVLYLLAADDADFERGCAHQGAAVLRDSRGNPIACVKDGKIIEMGRRGRVN